MKKDKKKGRRLFMKEALKGERWRYFENKGHVYGQCERVEEMKK